MKLIQKMALLTAFLLCLPCFANAEQLLTIKYRATPVDVDKPYFEHLDTSESSFVEGAWYDAKQKYMVINLKGTNYHYCGLDGKTWDAFKKASSFGTAYNQSIKGNFDCRVYPVPSYE